MIRETYTLDTVASNTISNGELTGYRKHQHCTAVLLLIQGCTFFVLNLFSYFLFSSIFRSFVRVCDLFAFACAQSLASKMGSKFKNQR